MEGKLKGLEILCKLCFAGVVASSFYWAYLIYLWAMSDKTTAAGREAFGDQFAGFFAVMGFSLLGKLCCMTALILLKDE